MSVTVVVSDPMHKEAKKVAEERDVSVKEAFSIMAREGGYDV